MTDVAKVQQDIDNERLKFLGLRQKLMTTLAAFKAPPETPDHLISFAEEFGPDQAVKKLGEDPKFFRVDIPVAVRREISPLVLTLVDTSYSLDALVRHREEILCKADPRRERRYISYGREFTLDMGAKKIRYDDDGSSEPMNLVEGKPLNTPDRDGPPDRGAPGGSPDKKRDRSM
jgi:hypothetical protein